MNFSNFLRRILNFFRRLISVNETEVNEITSFEHYSDDNRILELDDDHDYDIIHGQSIIFSNPLCNYIPENVTIIIPEELYLDIKNLEDNNLKCPICLEIISTNVLIIDPCKHKFCETCINRVLKFNNICPCCRGYVKTLIKSKFYTDMILDSLVSCPNNLCSEKIKKRNFLNHKKVCLFLE
jgi:hypothetical protein